MAAARARRRPGRWLLAVTGVALSVGYAGAIVADSTITADRAARAALASLDPTDRAVRLSWQGVVTTDVQRRASNLLRGLGLHGSTEVVLLNPVRLGGAVVRPAALAPLTPWVLGGTPPGTVTHCVASSCPVLLAGGSLPSQPLTAPGVRMPIGGRIRLRSPLTLGFVPRAGDTAAPPLLLSGDPRGLEALTGLDGIYRTHSWLSPLPIGGLHSWQLAALERRLRGAQSTLLATNSQFAMTAPFAGLATARAQAAAAPSRLLLAGGGAVAALAMFVLLAAGGLRRDRSLEVDRLRSAGARTGQTAAFLAIEAALLSGLAVLVGAALGLLAATALAHAGGEPAGAVLAHSLISPGWGLALIAGWLAAAGLIAGSALLRTSRVPDALALAALATLVLGLSLDRGGGGHDPLPVLLAPLCALASGLLVFRGVAALLRLAERVSRRGPVLTRLALVGLARAPAAPSLAIAFIAVSIGLGGFALCYRATLLRGAADQAAQRVPLDGIIATGSDFTRPLQLASLTRWRELTGGSVWPVRRTEASYVDGGASATVPALGIPAAAVAQIHGWRASDGSASIAALARRLTVPGPLRTPGPRLAPGMQDLSLHAVSPALTIEVVAVLRDRSGRVTRLSLGRTGTRTTTLRAMLPPGFQELQAIELREPIGLELTNGHQNGENPAAATQFTAQLVLGGLNVAGATLARWRGSGAVTSVRRRRGDAVIGFATSGMTGLLRPAQPSDLRPLPVLVDAGAPRSARLSLTIDGLPVPARVVGILRRFPTLPADAGGFVVADEPALAAALDAQAPGQGLSDELWQLGGRPARPFAALGYAWRRNDERALREAPIARGVLGTLIGGAALTGALAVVGLLVSLLGGLRDRRIELDLIAQGLGPRGLRRELRLRIAVAAVLGVLGGVVIAAVLSALAVTSVRAGTTIGLPRPPLVAASPWTQLALWAVAALGALGLAGWIGTAR